MFAFFSSMASRGGVGLARPWEASRRVVLFFSVFSNSPFDLSQNSPGSAARGAVDFSPPSEFSQTGLCTRASGAATGGRSNLEKSSQC